MGVNKVDLFRYLMDRYGKITEIDLKENQNIFNEAFDTTITIEKYFEIIYDCVQYVNDENHPYAAAQIIKHTYKTVLTTGLYK